MVRPVAERFTPAWARVFETQLVRLLRMLTFVAPSTLSSNLFDENVNINVNNVRYLVHMIECVAQIRAYTDSNFLYSL